VAALDPALAAPAAPDADPELRDQGTDLGQLGRELLGPALEVHALPAVRGALGQRGVEGAVGIRRRRAVAVAASRRLRREIDQKLSMASGESQAGRRPTSRAWKGSPTASLCPGQ